jgi:hypothetical protein
VRECFYLREYFLLSILTVPLCAIKVSRLISHCFSSLVLFLEQIPVWIDFNKSEKAAWLDSLLRHLWPYAKRAAERNIVDGLNGTFAWLQPSFPSFLKEMVMGKCVLSDEPLRVESVQVLPYKDGVCLDLKIYLGGDPVVIVDVVSAVGGIGVSAAIENLTMRGTCRLLMKPLIDSVNPVQCLSTSFIRYVIRVFLFFVLFL